ncbi:tRNA (guanosine(46)-N7)-methyltransferase TrmB [Thiospirillum jenense]|uniref:tRNA (guanine-N(7)-)-methyltransferase n=1 Tax=Thiospirillum jenense TaxID=1653858 RepID=A0A839HE31_9GAMM|nr:tRNA (guanosine(46)-N7)-methyltransferase TrmB [Thiospirillum jenense]MBB1127195.1 tRNA (guanosine(46)-N7)-methyltransferase TrmB [Thiospirillum jenense]
MSNSSPAAPAVDELTASPAPFVTSPPRPVRSFVRRQGRLTTAQARAFDELWPQFGCDWQPGTVLQPAALFGDDPALPVALEIGFGNGEALLQLASAHPERGYLGCDVHRPGVGHLLLELQRRELVNVRVVCHDAVELLGHALSSDCLSAVYLFFPDPWPKLRHHKRRLVQPPFVNLLARALRTGGDFHAATDWQPYAAQMLTVLDNSAAFCNAVGAGQFAPRLPERPLTRFEQRGQRLGHAVFDLHYRRR